MPRLVIGLLLLLLLTAGCPLPAPQQQNRPSSPESSTTEDADELGRRTFRQGLEAFSNGNDKLLQRLTDSEPHTIWGLTAAKLLQLNAASHNRQQQIETLRLQVRRLRKKLTATDNNLKRTQEQNRQLQGKLDELTRVLIELEKQTR
ncbi:hypothetical protein C2E25_02885 [Geothermobacter hydrogeniphilus]|uniref:Uncharacterized protein n=1 Tax=Geothermobacter hydrogeniphilus TaxID=1969733 RepID=A0A2K2HDC9_9BACT|nr:hypothetical protein [Geothermobacter hydrogeniphilus]PNU21253.1 hypothetical protein C2E25_02885 [Geothermobacter hydrogeniphilus]